jgi:Legionella pneumophila major outer membrane protein precursor
MMKKLLLISLLMLATLSAEEGCWIPRLRFLCGTPQVKGKALYWKPYGASVHYATTFPENDPIGSNRLLKSDYGWGYEVEAAYLFPANVDQLSLDFTKIDFATNGKVASDQEIVDPNGDTDVLARGTANQNYIGSNLTWSRRFYKSNCFRIDLFGGISYAGLDERIITDYTQFGGDQTWLMRLTKFRGLGPRLGVGTAWGPFVGFSIGGHVAASGPTGRRRYLTDDQMTESKARETVIIPAFDGRGWTRVSFDLCCYRFLIELGYEIRNFSCLFYRPTLDQPLTNQLVADCHFTLAGPYTSLAIRF